MEMMKKMTRLNESEAAYIMHQILIAVQYMHEKLVIHRDLKLGNLFLTENMEIKIGDFGLAAKLDYPEQRKQTLCGTPNYIAPEILRSAGHSYEVDVWSIGVILYTLLIGTPPFETSNVKETYKNIKDNNYSFPRDIQIGELAKDLIKSILIPDPAKRPTVSQILAHKFFSVHSSATQTCPSSLLQYASLYSSSSKLKSLPTNPPRSITAGDGQTARVPFKPIQNIIETKSTIPQSKPMSPPRAQPPLVSTLRQHLSSRKSPPLQRFQQPQPQTQPISYQPLAPLQLELLQQQAPLTSRLSPMTGNRSASPMDTVISKHSGSPDAATDMPKNAPLLNIQQYSSNNQSPTNSPTLTRPSSSNVETATHSEDDDYNNLTTMHENITQNFAAARERTNIEPAPKRPQTPTSNPSSTNGPTSAPRSSPSNNKMDIEVEDEVIDSNLNDPNHFERSSVWVSQWADFTSKYGLAYRLNNGVTGAHFNDASKLVWNHETGQINYIERKRFDTTSAALEERQIYHIDSYPSTLQKKITLIKHFRGYLDKDTSQKRPVNDSHDGVYEKDVYVKRWLKTRHAVIFRLSNKVVQVHFHDGTEIILSSEARLVTYTDAQRERKTFPLSTLVNNPQVDVSKRLKYTKDILYQLISKQSK